MAAKLPVWGIDIGQCSLKAIKLQAGDDKVELLAFDVVNHDTILSQVEGEAPEMCKKAIETFLSRNEVRDCHVVVSVPGQQTLTRFTKMPPVEKKKIPDMVKYEAGQQIPFDMDEVVWDYQIFTEEDSPDVEVGIFAIRRELIRNHLSQFTDLGLEPIIAQAGPMASYNAIRFDRPPAEGDSMILLDMGALATDLIVMEGNGIWSRPVPIGGNRFTEALVSAFKISFKKAEELKRNAASTKYARQIFQAMRPVFADMVSEVQRSIGFYTSTHREAHITKVLGMGNAFKLPGLQKFLQQNLQIEVEKMTGFNRLNTAGHEKKPEFVDNLMSLGVAYGLALQGLGLAAVESNLLPPEIRKSILWKKKRPWFGVSAACLALAAGSVWTKNMLTHGALDDGMGSVASAALMTSPGPGELDQLIEQSEQVLGNPPSNLPTLEYAKRIGEAVGKLKQLHDGLGGGQSGQTVNLAEIAKLPQDNVLIPRIMDVIQRSFAEVNAGTLSGVESAADYRALAGRTSRDERNEVWIDNIDMSYVEGDPRQVFVQDPSQLGQLSPYTGWAIWVTGRTTNPRPEELVGATLVEMLDTLGKQPGRKFYLDAVKLAMVKDVPKRASSGFDRGGGRGFGGRQPAGGRPGGRAGGRREPFGGRPGGRDGGRPGGRDGGRPGGRDGGRPGGRPGFQGPSGGNSGGRLSQPLQPRTGDRRSERDRQADREKLALKDGVDPVTGEDSSTDRMFELQLVAFKADTPKKVVPDRWKTEEERDKEPGDQPAPAGGPPPPVDRG